MIGHWSPSLALVVTVILAPIAARFSNFQLERFCHVLQQFPHFKNLSACSLDFQLLPFKGGGGGGCGLLVGLRLGLGFRLRFRLGLGLGIVLGLGQGFLFGFG